MIAPVLESLFNKVDNFIKNRLQQSSVFLSDLRNFSDHFFRGTSANDCFETQKQFSRGVL